LAIRLDRFRSLLECGVFEIEPNDRKENGEWEVGAMNDEAGNDSLAGGCDDFSPHEKAPMFGSLFAR
jgi:hypothetical protein